MGHSHLNNTVQRAVQEAAQALVSQSSPEAALFLSSSLASTDRSVTEIVLGTLRAMAEQGAIAPLYKLWVATQDSRLTLLLAEGGWMPDFSSHLKVFRCLESKRFDLIVGGGTEVVGPLIHAIGGSNDELKRRALLCLNSLTNSDSLDAICESWVLTRSPDLEKFIQKKEYVAQAPPAVRILTALLCDELSLVRDQGADSIEPLLCACADKNPLLSQRAKTCLLSLEKQDAIDALASVWAFRRSPELNSVMETALYVAAKPLRVKVLSALQAGKVEILDEPASQLAETLAAATRDQNDLISGRAKALLEKVLDDLDAQEVLCRVVVGQDNPIAQDMALRRGLTPRRAHSRALYYFLTEQWPEYEALDFDMSLLRQAYEHGGKDLRSRIANRARRAGRLELVELVAGARHKRRMGEMTIREWTVILGILRDRKDYETMWRLAKTAPAVWAVEAIQILSSAGWNPADGIERMAFVNLLALACACQIEAPVLGMSDQPTAKFKAHGRRVSTLIVSSYFQSTLASGSWDGSVRIWSMPAGERLNNLDAYTHPVTCIAATPDGSTLAAGCGSHRAVRIWTMPEGKPLKVLDGHVQGVACLAVSYDGRLLAVGCFDNNLRLWRMGDSALLAILKGHTGSVRCASFSPDGRILATGSEDNTVRLWDVSDGRLVDTLRGHDLTVRSLAFLPDGKVLASAGSDNNILLWSIPDRRFLTRLVGHSNVVSALAVSGDGRVLASSSWDQSVRLWAMPGGSELGVLGEHDGPVTCLATDPESRTLVSGGHDCAVVMWNFQSGIFRRPTVRNDMDKLESLMTKPAAAHEKAWMNFLMAQMKSRWGSDIEVFHGLPRIEAGEFDIEVEG